MKKDSSPSSKPKRAYCHTALPQPYKHLDQVREVSRLSADISFTDKHLIKKVCPREGILNQITQLFFNSISLELEYYGITYYSPDNEQVFLDIIRRRTTFESPRKISDGYVGAGTPRPCAAVEGGVEFDNHLKENDLQ